LEKCCLLLSSNESYERAEQDIQVLTGISVSHSTQQRLVHRHTFAETVIGATVEEMSINGGKVRLRTPQGQKSIWNDYKAIRFHEQVSAAYFKDNAALIEWANRQKLGEVFLGLGDGHNGIWNLFEGIGTPQQCYEILDWYHLMENLYKVPGSLKRIEQVEALLWDGNVESAIEVFKGCTSTETSNFVTYLQKHRSSTQLELLTTGRIFDWVGGCGISRQTNWQTSQTLRGSVGCREYASSSQASLCLSQWLLLHFCTIPKSCLSICT
jgi:hypothetical protein